MAASFGTLTAISPHVIQELDRQLEEWRSCLPPSIQFTTPANPLDLRMSRTYQPRPTHERLLGYLKGRYCAAKAIIYRPYVYEVLHCDHPASLSEHAKRGAHISLESALHLLPRVGLLHEPMALLLFPMNIC